MLQEKLRNKMRRKSKLSLIRGSVANVDAMVRKKRAGEIVRKNPQAMRITIKKKE